MGFSDTFDQVVGGLNAVVGVGTGAIGAATGGLGGIFGGGGAAPAQGGSLQGPAAGAGGGGLQETGFISPAIRRLLGIGGGGAAGGGAAGGGGGAILKDILGGVGGGIFGGLLTGLFGGSGVPMGKPALYTVVLAVYPDGTVEERERMRGKPYLMTRDVQVARKVAKRSASIRKRMPKQTVRESPMKQLQNTLMQNAIANATRQCA